MNRRGFLELFAAGVGSLVLPEPRRVYSFANVLRVPSWNPRDFYAVDQNDWNAASVTGFDGTTHFMNAGNLIVVVGPPVLTPQCVRRLQ